MERENVPALEWSLSCLQSLCFLMSLLLGWTLPLQYQWLSYLKSELLCEIINNTHFFCSLSTAGRVIVLAIHQPRYSIFKLFDSLTLLYNGELVYHGPAGNALEYFNRLGIRSHIQCTFS